MNRKTKIIVSVVGIIIVTLALLGITYAYYLTRIQGNTNTNSISVTTAKLELVYSDNSEEIISSNTALMPKVGTDAIDAIGTKTFTVTNNGNDSSYVVIIDNVSIKNVSDNSNTTFLSNDFRYTLTCTVKDKSGNLLEGETCNKVTNQDIFPIKGGILVSNNIKENKVHEYTLTLWYIDTGVNQSDDMGKSYQARVNIKDMTAVNPFSTGVSATDNASLVYNIINNAKTNKNGTTLVNAPLTNPAEQISSVTTYETTGEEAIFSLDMSGISSYTSNTWYYYDTYEVDTTTGKFTLSGKQSCTYSSCYSNLVGKYLCSVDMYENSNANNHTATTKTNLSNIYKVVEATSSSLKYVYVFSSPNEAERVLVPTTDDYGTSYYYRGDVEDNYINFAGMCWRIVRIAGDGSTKLILEDQYTTCDDTETETTSAVYTGNWNIGQGNYGYDSSSKNTSGSTLYKMNYLNPVTDNTSSMVKVFYDFQTSKLVDYTSKLKSGDWCLGDKAYTSSGSLGSYTYTLLEDTSSNYLSKTSFYYDAYTRLTSGNANGYQPTLKCNGTILNEFANVSRVSSKAPMYVSAITADEIVYAGGKYGAANRNYYLINNYQKSNYPYFWSLSPSSFDTSNDYAFLVEPSGNLIKTIVDGTRTLRPSVSLASSAVITGGEGTLEKPYVIG